MYSRRNSLDQSVCHVVIVEMACHSTTVTSLTTCCISVVYYSVFSPSILVNHLFHLV